MSADRLRDEIAAAGWIVHDTPGGGFDLTAKPPFEVWPTVESIPVAAVIVDISRLDQGGVRAKGTLAGPGGKARYWAKARDKATSAERAGDRPERSHKAAGPALTPSQAENARAANEAITAAEDPTAPGGMIETALTAAGTPSMVASQLLWDGSSATSRIDQVIADHERSLEAQRAAAAQESADRSKAPQPNQVQSTGPQPGHPDQGKLGQGQASQGQPSEAPTDQGRPSQGRSGEVRSGEGRFGDVQSDHGLSGEPQSGRGRSDQGRSGEVGSGQPQAGQPQAGQVGSGQLQAGHGRSTGDLGEVAGVGVDESGVSPVVSVGILVDGWPDDLQTCVESVIAHTSAQIVALDLGDVDGAGAMLHELAARYPDRIKEWHVAEKPHWRDGSAGWGASRTKLLHLDTADIHVVLETSTVFEGDAITPLVQELDADGVEAAGWRGVNPANEGHKWEDAGPGQVKALLGHLFAVRRVTALGVGGFPERARFYRNADLEFSLSLPGTLVVPEKDLPVREERHRGYHDVDPDYRDKESRRTYDRVLKRLRETKNG
ncbi:hypothetical protein Aple_054260 [Acrocarpospora pleiomorpha]|uniref:Uncharacterized protein n=1 Tax=Acrocarpospora pleiomorpha TaxID=90975 RepID=A0A5M3XVY4_9ACTN|nr:hypothetical protein Aple_054260 [Acrocarpospora pleiomorpha]